MKLKLFENNQVEMERLKKQEKNLLDLKKR